MKKCHVKAVWAAGMLFILASAHGRDIPWDLPPMATWTDDPKTTVTLAWEYPRPAPATLTWGPTGQETTQSLDLSAVCRHVVHLDRLLPGTEYAYSISRADRDPVRGTFKTAPASPDTPFSFVLHNDLQGGITPDAARAVSKGVVAAKPDFVFSTGDLSDSRYGSDYANVLESWRLFFNCCREELASFVFQPVAGNHDEPENPDSFWYRLMELPGDKRNYTFDVGPVRFICVDSSEFEVPAQTAWLTRELQRAAADTNILWTLPAFHRPPFSEGERGGQEIICQWWVPLFTRYEAGPVLSGHAHTYQRIRPFEGVDYLVSGGGGGWLYHVNPWHPTMAFATSGYHFVKFEVDGPLLRSEATTPEGHVFDSASWRAKRHVRVSPAFPSRGDFCTITYHPDGGPLADAQEVWIHMGRDEFNTVLFDRPMERDSATGAWRLTFTVPDSPKWNLAFCFHNGRQTAWHNNFGLNWQTLLKRDW